MKKTLAFIFSLLLGASFSVPAQAAALPSMSDPFWGVMSRLSTPDDPDCVSEATDYYDDNSISYVAGQLSATCSSIALLMDMEDALDDEGVDTNLFAMGDWHNITGLYFEIEGLGKIEFSESIDFMSYDFLTFLSTLTERISMGQGEISLDADIVGGLNGYGAVLTMYNAGAFNSPEILVDGEEDDEGVVSNLSYDPNTQNIIFDAKHFTTFKAVEHGDYAKNKKRTAKIDSIEAERIVKNGKEMIRLEIKGRKFSKDITVKLGDRKANKISWKSKNKIIAYFNVKKLEKTSSPAYVKVKNDDTKKSDRFENPVDWKKLKLAP